MVNDANKERELELLTIENVLKTESGRAFMYRCLQNCYTFSSTFKTDPIDHAFVAGSRKHGLWLVSELKEASLDLYLLMLKENDNG